MRRKIVRAIERYHDQHDQWPTLREIGAAIGVSAVSHVRHHALMLAKQGIVTYVPGVSRGVALARAHEPPLRIVRPGIRILGRIAAGTPLDLYETGEEEMVDVGRDMLGSAPPEDVFALRVAGDSMIEDGILNGDLVLVRRGPDAPRGAIAVVVERSANGGQGAATLKRIYKEDDEVRLQPANATHTPIHVEAEAWDREWEVQGTLLGVCRRYDAILR
jgi:repressor LexA